MLNRGDDRIVIEVETEMEDCGNGATRNNTSSSSSSSSNLGLDMSMAWRPSLDTAFGVYVSQQPTVNVSGGSSLRSRSLGNLERKSVCSQFLLYLFLQLIILWD